MPHSGHSEKHGGNIQNATAMTSMPDMSGAVRLEDITSCAEGCTALEKAMELPGNIKQAKKHFTVIRR